jgi:hypothetical protein
MLTCCYCTRQLRATGGGLRLRLLTKCSSPYPQGRRGDGPSLRRAAGEKNVTMLLVAIYQAK